MIYVPAIGPKDAKIVIVGEAPGADEEKQKKPFVGYSGSWMREQLMRAGIKPDSVYITNVCKFRPPYNKIEKWISSFGKKNQCNDKVLAGVIELFCDLAEIKPTLIVPMGNTALWALTGHMQISKRRGSVMALDVNVPLFEQIKKKFPDYFNIAADAISQIQGTKIIPSLHPAGVLREQSMVPIFQLDLKRIAEDATFKELRLPKRIHYTDPSQELAVELVEKILKSPQTAVDIECVGRNLFCVGFSCDPSWSLVLTWNSLWKRELIKLILEHPIKKIFQNGLFDVPFLKNNGVVVNNYVYDTMLAQAACYVEFPKGLDFQTSIYTREPYFKDEGKDWNNKDALNIKQFLEYNGKDNCVTLEIAEVQQKEELVDENFKQTFDYFMSQTPLAIDMMLHGIKINSKLMQKMMYESVDKSSKLQAELDKEVLLSLQKVAKQQPKRSDEIVKFAEKVAKGFGTDKGGLNVYSPKDVGYFIYDILGMKVKKGKTGNRTTNEEALKELLGSTGNEMLLKIVKIREERKLQSNYLNIKLDENDRTYFSINIVGTKTFRWSMSKTLHDYGLNMQTFPGHTRILIIPDDPSLCFISLDLAQAEDRVVTYFAGVGRKIEAFENGWDVHALTASLIFNTTIEEVKKQDAEFKQLGKQGPMRYLGKQSNHAFNYGEGPRQFLLSVNKRFDETGVRIDYKTSNTVRNGHLRNYPEIEYGYWKEIESRVRSTRTLINPFGDKRVFYGAINDALIRDAYSWIPQSIPPRIVNMAAVQLFENVTRKDRHIRTMQQGHDSLLIQAPVDGVEEVAKEVVKLMTIPFEVNGTEITIPVDYGIGPSWGEAK